MRKSDFFSKVKGKLIVSCQALEDEPLHGSNIMAKMAVAAEQGGASGIRANGSEDIKAIEQVTSLPIIGLVKRDYEDSEVYITPTRKEVDELLDTGVVMIALDATSRRRPNEENLPDLITYIKQHGRLVLADISTVEEGLKALEYGADCVSTTLSGYTSYTRSSNSGPDIELVEELSRLTSQPVIAEGRVNNPEEVSILLEKGAHTVVVGSAITRPQHITEKFVQALNIKNA
ncbi:N-acetylmannosamine-6-phosphate 2-epimerase [Psychrobacillus sp. BL-248-WT-3]|uniref:N-acetylmannosamine-6-phosphate 2-epimerase n=1 Tax=Psychrobacillus sp. BL-248-WT-3 TaxID=2725306 RepID=UPI00146AE3CD|nr:N-acetylmannosamine-6-phosphate 2-epimerase [Psychrobacillus sp. BL-248-WT-3]NME06833.1 N-acetylmannosamine-6-phosphate 2-epimerase [Psychrobacillus sp. BL-248-WT-3]